MTLPLQFLPVAPADGVLNPQEVMGSDLTGWYQVGVDMVDDGGGKLVSLGNHADGVTKTLLPGGSPDIVIDLTGGPNSQPKFTLETGQNFLNQDTVEVSPSGGAAHFYALVGTSDTAVNGQNFVRIRNGSSVDVASYKNNVGDFRVFTNDPAGAAVVDPEDAAIHLFNNSWNGTTWEGFQDNVSMGSTALSGSQSAARQVRIDSCVGSWMCLLIMKVQPTPTKHGHIIAWFNDVYDLGLS